MTEEQDMPKVGSKHFPYTKEGYAQAHAAAKEAGKQVESPRGRSSAKANADKGKQQAVTSRGKRLMRVLRGKA